MSNGVTAISAGHDHTCAVTMGGAVKCWGRNDGGQLGDRTTTDRRTPVGVLGSGEDRSLGVVDTDHAKDGQAAELAARYPAVRTDSRTLPRCLPGPHAKGMASNQPSRPLQWARRISNFTPVIVELEDASGLESSDPIPTPPTVPRTGASPCQVRSRSFARSLP